MSISKKFCIKNETMLSYSRQRHGETSKRDPKLTKNVPKEKATCLFVRFFFAAGVNTRMSLQNCVKKY